jgi:hypothetical protein
MVLDLGGGTSVCLTLLLPFTAMSGLTGCSQDLSIIAMGRDDKWKLDMDLVSPVSSDRFGAALIDRSVRALVEKYALLHDLDPHQASSIASSVTFASRYLTAKIKLQNLEWSLGRTGLSAAETTGEIHVENDKLILEGYVPNQSKLGGCL